MLRWVLPASNPPPVLVPAEVSCTVVCCVPKGRPQATDWVCVRAHFCRPLCLQCSDSAFHSLDWKRGRGDGGGQNCSTEEWEGQRPGQLWVWWGAAFGRQPRVAGGLGRMTDLALCSPGRHSVHLLKCVPVSCKHLIKQD